jgi:hypothetical protein
MVGAVVSADAGWVEDNRSPLPAWNRALVDKVN